MQFDMLNLGTEETLARYTLVRAECELLMDAASALREARFPGLLDRLPRHFGDEELLAAVGSEEAAADVMALLELEGAFHHALHMFPGGHSHD
ncbi:MAG: hypothetical protein VKS61_15840 [Candidatus Sericytochromatia bacterium]|nr:hypothetical protein [Candidatus Sericytochromatia bacterium]